MTIFYEYDENGHLLTSEDTPLSPDNLSRYIAEFGEERAKGYQDALSDILRRIETGVIYAPRAVPDPHPHIAFPNSPSKALTELNKFLMSSNKLFEAFRKVLPE